MVKRMIEKRQKQKQRQSQIVNINLGSRIGNKKRVNRKKKGKVERREGAQPLTAFNPPPIINFPPGFMPKSMADANQPNYFNRPPPPPPQKETAAFPEGETAGVLNLNPTIPVPFSFIGAEERLKAPPKEERLVESKTEEAVILPTEPPEEELQREEEENISVLSEGSASLPEEARSNILSEIPSVEVSILLENKEPLFDPFNLAVPATSGRSLASLEEASYQYTEPGLSLPQSRFLGKLPPIKAEKIELPFSPLPPSGLTLPKEKPKPFFGETPPPAVEAPKKGRPAGSKNKPKKKPSQTLFESFPITANVEPLGVPIQTGLRAEEPFKYSPPLSQLGGQYEFIGQPKQPTEKEVGGLERRRGGGVLTAAEEAIIGGTPPFLNAPTFIA